MNFPFQEQHCGQAPLLLRLFLLCVHPHAYRERGCQPPGGAAVSRTFQLRDSLQVIPRPASATPPSAGGVPATHGLRRWCFDRYYSLCSCLQSPPTGEVLILTCVSLPQGPACCPRNCALISLHQSVRGPRGGHPLRTRRPTGAPHPRAPARPLAAARPPPAPRPQCPPCPSSSTSIIISTSTPTRTNTSRRSCPPQPPAVHWYVTPPPQQWGVSLCLYPHF